MIPSQREIQGKLEILRSDGETWEDVSDYLTSVSIQCGDVSSVGTGALGVDDVVRYMEFTLHNNRLFMWWWDASIARDETYVLGDETDVIGDETDGAEVWIRLLFGAGESNNVTFSPLDLYSSFNTHNGSYDALLWPNRLVRFYARVLSDRVAGAWTTDSGWIPMFYGYLGQSIRTEGPTVTCECRDLARKLQRCFVETKREYGSSEGVAVETVMQSILDDNSTGVTLYYSGASGFAVRPYELEHKSVWDALQDLVSQFGWYLGYKYDAGWKPTLLNPPTDKTAETADFTYDYTTDFHIQALDITDEHVRNAVQVVYRDISTGRRESVTVTDATSISNYGRLAMQIEQDEASHIDTSTEATALANAALNSLKDLVSTTRIEMPFEPTLDVFAGVNIYDPRIATQSQFYGVNSVRHDLDFAQARFRTEFTGQGRVIAGFRRWLDKEARPGSWGNPTSVGGVIGAQRGATLVVAASDTPLSSRVAADYACSGSSDEDIINSALTSLSGGGKIVLLEGTYNIDGPINMVSNATLEGQGDSTLIWIANNASSAADAFVFSSVSNAELRYMKVDGNKANQTNEHVAVNMSNSDNNIVESLYITNMSYGGLYLDASDNNQFRSIDITGSDDHSVYITGSSENKLQYISITNSGLNGVCVQSSNITVLENLTVTAPTWDCVNIYNSENTVVSRCVLTGGIHGVGYSTAAPNTKIIACTISNSSGQGISLPRECVVTGNTVSGCTDEGIYVLGGSMKNASVTENVVFENKAGIYMWSLASGSVSNNQCYLNNQAGIFLSDCTSVQVSGNECHSNSQETNNYYANIYLLGNDDDCSIRNNICRKGSETNKPAYGIAIADASCNDNLVSGNDCRNGGVTAGIIDLGTNTRIGENRNNDGTWSNVPN